MPAGFQGEVVVDVDCDVQVTEGLLREEEIVEEIRGVLDEENENDDVEVAERSEDIVILVILDAEFVYYICKLGTNVGRKD